MSELDKKTLELVNEGIQDAKEGRLEDYEPAGLDKTDIEKIMAALAQAYEQKGKTIKTAVLMDQDENGEDRTEILVDNRDEKEIN